MRIKDAEKRLLDAAGMTDASPAKIRSMLELAIKYAKAKIAGWAKRDAWKNRTRARD